MRKLIQDAIGYELTNPAIEHIGSERIIIIVDLGTNPTDDEERKSACNGVKIQCDLFAQLITIDKLEAKPNKSITSNCFYLAIENNDLIKLRDNIDYSLTHRLDSYASGEDARVLSVKQNNDVTAYFRPSTPVTRIAVAIGVWPRNDVSLMKVNVHLLDDMIKHALEGTYTIQN